MTVPFYRAFEDRHRGSRELIAQRLQVYMAFLEPLKNLYQDLDALDLGCGRGEWLELLVQNGFAPSGVDLDSGMLEACQSRGLPAEQGDALSALRSLPDACKVVVSGFHIAEHIPFADLKVLVAEALRVLRPGGLLVLETPNAENLMVGTQNFYLDPTHERPIPHLLLSFLTEYTGFARSKLLRLQESASLVEGSAVDLMSVLGGVSPDYAIVAQKAAEPEQLEHFNPAFERDYGLALDSLAKRYDDQAEKRSHMLEVHADLLHRNLTQISTHVKYTERHSKHLEASVRELLGRNANAEARLDGLEAGSNQLRHQLQDLSVRSRLAEDRYEQTERMGRELSSRASEAEARLSAAQAINELLQTQLLSEKNQVLQLQTRSDSLKSALGEHADRNRSLEAELAELEAAFQAIALEQPAPQQEDLARRMQQLADAQDREELLEAQIDTFKHEASKAETHIRLLETSYFQASEQIEQLQQSLAHAEEEVRKAHSQTEVEFLNARISELKAEAEQLNNRLNESLGNAHHWWERATAHETRLEQVLSSSSWRITSPLRALVRAFKWLIRLPFRIARRLLRSVLATSINMVLKRPGLRQRLARGVRSVSPALFTHLERFARHRGILSTGTAHSRVTGGAPITSAPVAHLSVGAPHHDESPEESVSSMTPGARRIYTEMKKASMNKEIH
jgi:SAM-dependent methyltransferase